MKYGLGPTQACLSKNGVRSMENELSCQILKHFHARTARLCVEIGALRMVARDTLIEDSIEANW